MGWICAEATDLVVDRFLGRRETEKSREVEESSLSCWGRMVVEGKIDWLRKRTS